MKRIAPTTCEAYGGIWQRNTAHHIYVCCANSCGEDKCGKVNCAEGDGGHKACCAGDISETCSTIQKAPCRIDMDAGNIPRCFTSFPYCIFRI